MGVCKGVVFWTHGLGDYGVLGIHASALKQ